LHAQRYVSINDEYLYHNRTSNNQTSLSRGYTKRYWDLITPLIKKLYDDVLNFKEMDLKLQMDLCTFFFGASGVKNECESREISFVNKLLKLHKIVTDDRLQKAIETIEWQRLSNFYKMIFGGIKTKSGLGIYFRWKLYFFRMNVLKPIRRKIRG
jgi:hypothetical protein